jgi:hypothetical protein
MNIYEQLLQKQRYSLPRIYDSVNGVFHIETFCKEIRIVDKNKVLLTD